MAEKVRRDEYAEMLKQLEVVEALNAAGGVVADSVSSKRKSGKKKKEKSRVDTKSLRGNASVQKEVDRLMGSTVGETFAGSGSTEESESSSEESSTGTSSSSSRSSSSSSDRRRKRRVKKKSHKKEKKYGAGSRKKKHVSGKDRKSSSRVLYPQEWPHNHLGQHLATKEKRYEQLTIAEFCAGYAAIMEEVLDQREAKYRLRHFKDLMYFATRFSWVSVLTFHSACLYEIERGTKTWRSSFHKLESTTLMAAPVARKSAVPAGKPTTGGPILYCAAFQKGECSHTKDHEGLLKGETRMLKHICAKCWLNEKKFASHPQSACTAEDKEEEH